MTDNGQNQERRLPSVLAQLVAISQETIVVTDSSGKICLLNPSGELFWEQALSDFAEHRLDKIVQFDDDFDAMLQQLETASDTTEGVFGEGLALFANNQPIPVLFACFQEPTSGYLLWVFREVISTPEEQIFVRAIGVGTRVSELQSEVVSLIERVQDLNRELAEERRKTEAVLTGMGEGVLVVDEHGRIVQVNPAAARLLDLSARDLLDKQAHDTQLPARVRTVLDEVLPLHSERFEPGQTPEEKTVLVQEKVLRLTLAPIYLGMESHDNDSEQSPDDLTNIEIYAGVVLNLHDTTREAEADRAKDELISIVSHELRSPLASVAGYIDLILAGETGQINDTQKEFLNVAHSNALRLADLVNTMLDLSRMEAGKIEMLTGDVDIGYLISYLVMTYRPQAQQQQITLTQQLEGEVHALGDENRIQQALGNLISNAIKYTPQDGAVKIRARHNNGQVLVEVQDNGYGMSPEDQRGLFQKFYRVRRAHTRKIRGTGLGLSIVKSIVEAHGGHVEVDSQLEKGSTFRVVLPAWQP